MDRYASWRRRSEDPDTAWGWFVPMTFRGHAELHPRGLIGLAVITGFVLLMAWIARNPVLLFCFGASIAFFIDRPEAHLHATIPTLGEGTDATPVVLSIFDANGHRTGKEMGWVALADGWLAYEGLRTSFALNREAVEGSTYLPGVLTLTLHDGRRIEFHEVAGVQQSHLPKGTRQNGYGYVAYLAGRIREWSKAPSASGTALLPPRLLHPEAATDKLAVPAVGVLFGFLFASLGFWGGFVKLGSGGLLLALGSLVWFAVDVRRFQRKLPSLIE